MIMDAPSPRERLWERINKLWKIISETIYNATLRR